MKVSLKDDNRGVAFVTVIMVMLVLSLLSASVMTVSTSNLKSGLNGIEFQSAYYIAEAGANYGFEYFKNKVLNNDLTEDYLEISASSGHFSNQYGDSPVASIKLIGPVAGDNPQEVVYVIESRGTVDDISRTVTKSFVLKRTSGTGGGSRWKSEYAIFTKDDMDIGSGEVNGPIFSNDNITLSNGGTKINGNVYARGNLSFTNSAKVYGDVYVKGFLEFRNWSAYISKNAFVLEEINTHTSNTPEGHIGGNIYAPASGTEEGFVKMNKVEPPSEDSLPEFPAFPTENSYNTEESITTEWDNSPYTLELNKPVTYIPEINVISNRELTIKYRDKDILMVDKLNIPQGRIFLEGTGTLNLYIRDSMELSGGSVVNYPTSVDLWASNYTADDIQQLKKASESLVIYLKGDGFEGTNKNITFHGNNRVCASIYAEDANITITAGAKIHGNIFTGGREFIIDGGSQATTQIIYAPNAHVIMGGSGNLKGPIVANTFESEGQGNVSYNPESDSDEMIQDPFFPETGDTIEIIPGPVTEK